MKYNVDAQYIVNTLTKIADVPSVVGYSKQLNPKCVHKVFAFALETARNIPV